MSGLRPEVADGSREITPGAYRVTGIEDRKAETNRNRRVGNPTHGGVGGRREQSRLLPDHRRLFRGQLY